MAFDGAFLYAVTEELQNTVLGARIEKVLQPENDEIVLMLHTASGSAKLLLSASPSCPRVQLTEVSKKNPIEPPTFCMVLRKYITGGRIIDIEQPDFDRILVITVQTKNDLQDIVEKKLICEMMGKYSNIILTDGNLKILDCIRRVYDDMSSVRELLPGITYEKPPQGEKVDPRLYPAKVEHPFSENYYAERFCGISLPTGRELLLYENSGDEAPITTMLDRIRSGKPVTYLNQKGKPDMLPYKYDSITAEMQEWESPSELLDKFYEMRDKQNRLQQYTANMTKLLRNILAKDDKKKGLLEKELADAEADDKSKLYGELLSANIFLLSKGMDKVKVQNYYDENCAEIEIPLRVDLTPSENIQRYYKRYTKCKSAVSEITKQLDETSKEIEYIGGQLYNAEYANTVEEIDEIASELVKQGYMKSTSKARKKPEKDTVSMPSEYKTTAGRTVFVGHNNKQNEYLTHKLADANDIWLHAKNIPASHVILKAGGAMPEQCIIEAATLAAYNSSCRGATRIPVDYCFKKNVKKVSGAKPGFVIYDNYFTVIVDGTEEAVNKITKKKERGI